MIVGVGDNSMYIYFVTIEYQYHNRHLDYSESRIVQLNNPVVCNDDFSEIKDQFVPSEGTTGLINKVIVNLNFLHKFFT